MIDINTWHIFPSHKPQQQYIDYRVADPVIWLIFGCSSGANKVETMYAMNKIDEFSPKKFTILTKKTPVDTMDKSPFNSKSVALSIELRVRNR